MAKCVEKTTKSGGKEYCKCYKKPCKPRKPAATTQLKAYQDALPAISRNCWGAAAKAVRTDKGMKIKHDVKAARRCISVAMQEVHVGVVQDPGGAAQRTAARRAKGAERRALLAQRAAARALTEVAASEAMTPKPKRKSRAKKSAGVQGVFRRWFR